MKAILEVLKTKVTSRKFLVAVAGILSGIALIASGNAEEGVTAIVSSVVAYMIAEGFIDAVAVKTKKEEVEDKIEGKVEDVLEEMSGN